MTMRLSIKSFAGIALTLVAVGIDRDASIFAASVLAIPLRMLTWSSACSSVCGAETTGAWAGIGVG